MEGFGKTGIHYIIPGDMATSAPNVQEVLTYNPQLGVYQLPQIPEAITSAVPCLKKLYVVADEPESPIGETDLIFDNEDLGFQDYLSRVPTLIWAQLLLISSMTVEYFLTNNIVLALCDILNNLIYNKLFLFGMGVTIVAAAYSWRRFYVDNEPSTLAGTTKTGSGNSEYTYSYSISKSSRSQKEGNDEGNDNFFNNVLENVNPFNWGNEKSVVEESTKRSSKDNSVRVTSYRYEQDVTESSRASSQSDKSNAIANMMEKMNPFNWACGQGESVKESQSGTSRSRTQYSSKTSVRSDSRLQVEEGNVMQNMWNNCGKMIAGVNPLACTSDKGASEKEMVSERFSTRASPNVQIGHVTQVSRSSIRKSLEKTQTENEDNDSVFHDDGLCWLVVLNLVLLTVLFILMLLFPIEPEIEAFEDVPSCLDQFIKLTRLYCPPRCLVRML